MNTPQLRALKTAPTDEPLESPQSFAPLIRATPQFVRNKIRDGTIPTVICCGKVMRFRRADALAALAGKPKPRPGYQAGSDATGGIVP